MMQRQLVKGSNLQCYPYNCIGWIIPSKLSSGTKIAAGNGFLISPNLVLTAANTLLKDQTKSVHLLNYYTSFWVPENNTANQKKIRNVKIHPDMISIKKQISQLTKDLKSEPNQIKIKQINNKIRYLYRQGMKFDFALLELDKDIKRDKYFESWQNIEKTLKITVSGYQEDPIIRQFCHWAHRGMISQIKDGAAFYSIDTLQGQIGSPVYISDGDNIRLIGIHQGFDEENQLNYCTLITEDLITKLKKLAIKEISLNKQLPTMEKDTTINKRFPSIAQDQLNNNFEEKLNLIKKSEKNIIEKAKLVQISELESNQLKNKQIINQKDEKYNKLKKQMAYIMAQNTKLKERNEVAENKLNKIISQSQYKYKQYENDLEFKLKDIRSLKQQINNRNDKQYQLESIIKAQKNQIQKLKKQIEQIQNQQTEDSYKNYKKPKAKQIKIQQSSTDKKITSQIQKNDVTQMNYDYGQAINLQKKQSKNKDVPIQKQYEKSPINKIGDKIYDKDSLANKYKYNEPQINKIQSKNENKYLKDKQSQQPKVQGYKKQSIQDKYNYKQKYANEYEESKGQINKKQNIIGEKSSKSNQFQKESYCLGKMTKINKQYNPLKRRELRIQFASQSFQKGYIDISLEQFEAISKEIQGINDKTFEDEDTLAYVYAFLSNLYIIKKDRRFRDFAKKAQLIYRKNPNIYFEEIITLRNNLAYAYQNQNDPNKAITIYNEVLDLQNQYYSINDERRLSTLNNIFCLYCENRQIEKGQNIFRQIEPILAKLDPNVEIYQICMRNCNRYLSKSKK